MKKIISIASIMLTINAHAMQEDGQYKAWESQILEHLENASVQEILTDYAKQRDRATKSRLEKEQRLERVTNNCLNRLEPHVGINNFLPVLALATHQIQQLTDTIEAAPNVSMKPKEERLGYKKAREALHKAYLKQQNEKNK